MLEGEPYAQLLRALGHYLDQRQAVIASIESDESALCIRWIIVTEEGTREELSPLDPFDLDVLRWRGRLFRDLAWSGGERAELLRTLGQNLDRDAIRIHAISEDGDGFVVEGTIGEKTVRRSYSLANLRLQSAERRASRSDGSPQADAMENHG
jgi:hypothetical protein